MLSVLQEIEPEMQELKLTRKEAPSTYLDLLKVKKTTLDRATNRSNLYMFVCVYMYVYLFFFLWMLIFMRFNFIHRVYLSLLLNTIFMDVVFIR